MSCLLTNSGVERGNIPADCERLARFCVDSDINFFKIEFGKGKEKEKEGNNKKTRVNGKEEEREEEGGRKRRMGRKEKGGKTGKIKTNRE